MTKKKKSAGQMVSFRVEDEAVAEILQRAENESETINDAIRQHGDDATIHLLRDEVERAKAKLSRSEEVIALRRRSGKSRRDPQ